ncbi:MAG: glycosyltransferase [Paludibacteraceae bacterium]|nr:glycosyltransferase [Paludibacteraceae bacterium]
MRVLELPSWYVPYGGQFVQHQAKALREQGIEVHILANNMLSWKREGLDVFNIKKHPLKSFFTEEDGIPVYRNYIRPIPRANILNIRLWAKKTVAMYEQYAARYGHPDIMHVHSGTWGAYAASFIKKKWGIPYVVTEHRGMFTCQCPLARDFFSPEFREFFTEGFSNADCLIPVSDLLIPKMKEYLTKDVPFRVISNIVDTDFFIPSKETTPHKPFQWISVNGYRPVKGYDILLPAFDALCDKGADITLTLVGENFEHPDFQAMLAACHHRDKIRITGELNREGVRRELQNADAFVISSRVESQSVSVLEALSCGLPVAGTEVIPPYTLPKNLGLRVPVERPDLLMNAMQQVMKDYVTYNPQNAHKHAESIARKDVVAKQLVNVYTQIILNIC